MRGTTRAVVIATAAGVRATSTPRDERVSRVVTAERGAERCIGTFGHQPLRWRVRRRALRGGRRCAPRRSTGSPWTTGAPAACSSSPGRVAASKAAPTWASTEAFSLVRWRCSASPSVGPCRTNGRSRTWSPAAASPWPPTRSDSISFGVTSCCLLTRVACAPLGRSGRERADATRLGSSINDGP